MFSTFLIDIDFYFSSVFSRIIVYFKDDQFIPLIQSESQTLIGFLASCGGIFGLFMGSSLVSIIELIYYLSFRLYANTFSSNASN